MNYTQAVALAKEGKEIGFQFLYESTYKNKYYLALKYLKDEQTAQDVLQDAYIKAFDKLDALKNPETFPAWLGVIVGNLAKNRLQKKNPLLFSDIAVNDEEEPFEYEIEDETTDSQPELSYSKRETQQLVHEMINALSEEQRVCILMYEIEGIPIKEIAAALDCSENTVKSRLNYGQKNLKKKAEELQCKGYKLYGLPALPLLLLLLGKEKAFLSADGLLAAAQNQTAQHLISHAGAENFSAVKTTTSQNILEGGKQIATGIAKKGFLHTVAGKAVAVLTGIAVIGGAAGTALYISTLADTPEPNTQISSSVIDDQPQGSQQDAENQEEKNTSSQEAVSSDESDEVVFDETYAAVLAAIKQKKPGYTFENGLSYTGTIKYFYQDLNQDGIKELIVGAEAGDGPFMIMDCKFYSYRTDSDDPQAIELPGAQSVLLVCLPKDGNGLYSLIVSRGTGLYDCSRLSMENYQIKSTYLPEYNFMMGSSEEEAFMQENPTAQWIDLT